MFVRTSVPIGVPDITNILGGGVLAFATIPGPYRAVVVVCKLFGQSGTVRYALPWGVVGCWGQLVAVGCLLLFAVWLLVWCDKGHRELT